MSNTESRIRSGMTGAKGQGKMQKAECKMKNAKRKGGKIPPFGRDRDFSVTAFLRNDKIEDWIPYQVENDKTW